MRYQTTDWSIEVPKGWRHRCDEECTTLEHPQGFGAFQVSSYRKDDAVTDDDLRDLAGNIPLAAVSFGRFTGFRTRFSEGETFWTKWWLRAGRQMIHATYNCSLDDRGREDAEISSLIMSLVPLFDTGQV